MNESRPETRKEGYIAQCRGLLVGGAYDIPLDDFQQDFSSMDELRAILGRSFRVDGSSSGRRIVVSRTGL